MTFAVHYLFYIHLSHLTMSVTMFYNFSQIFTIEFQFEKLHVVCRDSILLIKKMAEIYPPVQHSIKLSVWSVRQPAQRRLCSCIYSSHALVYVGIDTSSSTLQWISAVDRQYGMSTVEESKNLFFQNYYSDCM